MNLNSYSRRILLVSFFKRIDIWSGWRITRILEKNAVHRVNRCIWTQKIQKFRNFWNFHQKKVDLLKKTEFFIFGHFDHFSTTFWPFLTIFLHLWTIFWPLQMIFWPKNHQIWVKIAIFAHFRLKWPLFD